MMNILPPAGITSSQAKCQPNLQQTQLVTGYAEFTIGAGRFAEAAEGLKDLAEGKNPESRNGQEALDERARPEPDSIPEKFLYADPIVCSSFPLGVPDAQAASDDLASARVVAPVMKYNTNATQYSSICVGGPKPAPGSQELVTSRSAHPTLLLSNTIDVSTPRVWADAVAKQLGERTLQVVTDQIGHGGGFDQPETKQQVIGYLEATN